MLKSSRYIYIVLLLVFSVLLSRCGTEKNLLKETEPNFTSIYETIITDCGTCHKPNTEVPELNLTSKSQAYTSLMMQSSRNGCESLKYVSAGSPNSSIFMATIDSSLADTFQETTNTACGITPINTHGIASLTAKQVDAVRTWINNGAANN